MSNFKTLKHQLFKSQSRHIFINERDFLAIKMIRAEKLSTVTHGLSRMNTKSNSQILSSKICSIWLIGKCEWFFVAVETRKCRSVTK
jgi:hypothetical protein